MRRARDFVVRFLKRLGVLGTVLTVFGGLQTLIQMADWAHWLIDIWARILSGIIQTIAGWLGIQLPTSIILPIWLSVFTLVFSVGGIVGTSDRREIQWDLLFISIISTTFWLAGTLLFDGGILLLILWSSAFTLIISMVLEDGYNSLIRGPTVHYLASAFWFTVYMFTIALLSNGFVESADLMGKIEPDFAMVILAALAFATVFPAGVLPRAQFARRVRQIVFMVAVLLALNWISLLDIPTAPPA